jgi:hypothetical protein
VIEESRDGTGLDAARFGTFTVREVLVTDSIWNVITEYASRAASGTRTRGTAAPRATLWWARIVCLSVFGPYVTGSARTEQIAVFVSFAVILIAGWPQIVKARSCAPLPFLVAWTGMFVIVLIGTLSRPLDLGFNGGQPVSHGLSDMLLPIALMTVTWYWTLRAAAAELIGAVAPIVVAAMVANTGISLAQVVTGNVVVFAWLPRFWDTPGSTGSVAQLAAENSRFTGIFDQPAEAGVAYGVALFCLIWLAWHKRVRPGLLLASCAAVLVIGGVLTVSKIFLLGALPLAVLMVLGSRRGRIRVTAWTAATVGVAWLLGHSGVLPAWPGGVAALRGFLHPSGGLETQYGAGRYGAGGTLGPVVSDVLHSSPWYGFGAGGLRVAYDSLWVEVLVLAGIAGVTLAASVLLMLIYRWLRLRGTLSRNEWSLAGATLALAIGGSLGLPTLTADRTSTLLWLIVGIVAATQPEQHILLRLGHHRNLPATDTSAPPAIS